MFLVFYKDRIVRSDFQARKVTARPILNVNEITFVSAAVLCLGDTEPSDDANWNSGEPNDNYGVASEQTGLPLEGIAERTLTNAG
jgi:hypothetical protein